MGKVRIFDRIIAALLGVLAAFGGMGVIATGMRFHEISITPLLLIFTFGCLVFALLAGTKLFPVIPVLMALGCLLLWHWGILEPAAESFLHQLSSIYDMGYHCGIIRWTDIPIVQSNSLWIFGILGLWIGLAVTWTAIRGRSAWLGILLAFAPLIPCIVFTDTVPHAGYLFAQFLSILLLLMTQQVRKRNLRQGGKALTLLFLPVALALGVLFLLMPQDDYQGQVYAQKMEDFFLQFFSPPTEEVPVEEPPIATETASRVHLTTVGPKAMLYMPVMTVTAQETGIMYLRGTSYDTYRGTHWDEDVLDDRLAFYNHGGAPKKVTISTRHIHDLLFLPYAPMTVTADGDIVKNGVQGRIENENSLREYTVTYSPVTYLDGLNRPVIQSKDEYAYILGPDGEYMLMIRPNPIYQETPRYLQLSDTTREAAEALLAQELPGLEELGSWEQALAIADFVRNSAVYDLETPRMPTESRDFAMWFLTESDTGYCTHFATATTVLLRAAGIPSRYVTGFITQTKADQPVTVLQKNAHAWTEVYIYGFGWVVLDATPSGGIDQTISAEYESTTQPTEATDPAETTDPTATTSATETTAPEGTDESTAPTEETIPTKPDVTKPNTGNSGEAPGQDTPDTPAEPFVLPPWAKTLLWILGIAGVIIGQWKLRVFLRRQRHTHGTNNARALAMWQDVQRYSRLLKVEPEENLLELAWKARFSQYRLTKEEVKAMEFGMNSLRRTLWNADSKDKWKKLYAQLILALY